MFALALLFCLFVSPTALGGASQEGEATITHGRDAEEWTYLAYVKPYSWHVGYGGLHRFKKGGEKLTINPTTEGIVGNERAQALLTRTYRSPWVVEKIV